MTDSLLDEVIEVAKTHVQGGVSILPTHRIQADLGLDSLSVMEFAADVETKFGVDIPKSMYESIQTVSDLAEAVRKLGGGPR